MTTGYVDSQKYGIAGCKKHPFLLPPTGPGTEAMGILPDPPALSKKKAPANAGA
jgi:hypothetical protein